ncbi:MAG: carboxypeptidase regulatory-like domain-containing protein [Bryobacterales bacterium]|nr:carboxypeptidase regulatory-like domain-containing protein [Bryobacteraceae bacterium]MDW8355125.1 carboxypeptidase regulatory-like domain-containing protein [Bryobacterales bacterium]
MQQVRLVLWLGFGLLAAAQTGSVFSSQAPPGASAPEGPKVTDPKQLSKVEGRVVHAQTGEPLRRVSLTLRRMAREAVSFVATSDQDGRFVFENVEPGTYQLTAERAGFLRQAYGARGAAYAGTPITVSPGQHLRDLDFKLLPQGVISGRVVDEEGEPVPRAQVMAMRVGARMSRFPAGSADATNDVGEFRIAGLAPGRYRVRAMPMREAFLGETVRPGNPDRLQEGFQPTYYPSATDAEAAAVIEVMAGQEVPGITIQLRKGPLYRIQGRVTGLTAERPANQLRVTLMPRRWDEPMLGPLGRRGTRVEADGSFLLTQVAPGSYYLTVMTFPGRMQAVGRVPVEVTTSDLRDVIVPLGGALTVSGLVRVEGQGKTEFGTMRVALMPAEGIAFNTPVGEIKADGTFQLDGVMGDKYSVAVMGAPENTYLKSVRVGGREVPEQELDLSHAQGGVQLEIVLSPNPAALEGFVAEQDKPAPGAAVVLVPEGVRAGRPREWRFATADQNGRFAFGSLRPGAYKLYAFDDPELAFSRDPEALEPFEQRALKVTLKEGERQSAQLTLLKAESGSR